MAKDRNGDRPEADRDRKSPSRSDRSRKSKRKMVEISEDSRGLETEEEKLKSKRRRSRKSSRNRSTDEEDDFSSYSSYDSSDSGSETSGSLSDGSDSSSEARKRRKRKERRRREREYEKEKRRRREKERKDEKKRRKEKEKKKKKSKEKGKKGPVTNSWGKYGIIRETDMWNKRPEFTAWLAEVKQVNLETLPNWEEKQMFKQFMEDHNTATFPSKKYYGLDAYHHRRMEKDQRKGLKKIMQSERTVFNDEEQRRQELLRERERQKEEQVEALKLSMQSGMAQAMKEQAQLREEMAFQYRLGNSEAAAAIQRRLEPDAPP